MTQIWAMLVTLYGYLVLGRLGRLRRQAIAYESAIRDSNHHLEQLKEEIEDLERRAKHANEELARAGGNSKRMVINQLNQIFRQVDLRLGREQVIVGNLERNEVALAKLKEVITGLEQGGATAEALLDIDLDVTESHEGMKQADKAAAKLATRIYQGPAVETESSGKPMLVSAQSEVMVVVPPDLRRRLEELRSPAEA